MPRDSIWSNQDGLEVGFGTHTADNNVAAVVGGTGPIKTLVVELSDATSLEALASLTSASFNVQDARLPRGSRILEASFQVTTGFTTGDSADLEIGTNSVVDFTADDESGIDEAVAVTALNAIGASVACNGALVNGVVSAGAASTSDVFISFSASTGAFTAGAGYLTVRYVEPQGNVPDPFLAVE
jgi:hypothetical protein